MLPSTGYFKGINCPFYDSGLCERPYCHFRHVKKESSANAPSDGIESGAILQKLVSAAVQKVLQQTEATAGTQDATADEGGDANKLNNSQHKATYNPTPIAELKKNNTETESNDNVTEQKRRHIPVPYTPRKPISMPIKRLIEDNGPSKPFVFIPPPLKYTPGCSKSVQLDPYTPKGMVESEEKYLPGTERELQEYKPKETQPQPSSKHNYVPSDRSVNKKKVLEYRPTKVNNKSETPSVTYQPTPKSLVPCFSSDEDEPEPKKVKLSNDLNGLDDLGPEFDILDQILDEENLSNRNVKSKGKEEPISNNIQHSEENQKHTENNKKHKKPSHKHNDKKSSSHKSDDKKSHEKSKTERDVKTKTEKDNKSNHSKNNSKSKDTTDKKSRKSSNNDKNREEEKKDKPERDKDKHSDFKKTDRKTKHSASKSSDRHSKSSAKHDSKHRENNHHHKSSKESSKDKYKKNKDKQLTNNDHPEYDAEDTTLVNNDDELLEFSESDEETIALECKRIFEEYVPTEKSCTNMDQINSNQSSLFDSGNDTEYVPSKKRISRTSDKNVKILPKAPLKPDYKVSAAQAMAERLAKIKEFHGSRNSLLSVNNEPINTKREQPESSFSVPHSANSKIRIAHVPYASTMMNAKKVITPISKIKSEEPSTSSTVIQTVKRGAQRIAHIPNEKFIDRPGVLEPLASKIAANIRSTYLNMMIDECLKIYLSSTDAYARAQHEELITSKKCSTVQIYKNSAVLTVSRLRKEFQGCNGVKKSSADCTALQRIPQTISGNMGNVGSWSIESKRTVNNSQEFTGAKFYKNVYKWVLTEEQLQENGFPRPHVFGEKGRAIIYGQNKKTPPKGLIRTCCRCKKDYIVDKKGFPAIDEECIYHPNNKYKVRGEAKYQCCSQDSSSDGCCVAPCHVYEYVDYENLKGFIKTMPPDCEMDDYGVYSLDCEMCYTTQGLDLTRVTVINSTCKVVYETLIKPLHPIIDYNTRYSGITEEQMTNVKTTLLEVQATLLSMFSSKTILVGHSLESDFKALKLIHDTVVDTSVLFPHKMGPPFKRALRNLSSEYLKKIIQNSVDGHDSAEDATVCMELLMYKLKEDLKTSPMEVEQQVLEEIIPEIPAPDKRPRGEKDTETDTELEDQEGLMEQLRERRTGSTERTRNGNGVPEVEEPQQGIEPAPAPPAAEVRITEGRETSEVTTEMLNVTAPPLDLSTLNVLDVPNIQDPNQMQVDISDLPTQKLETLTQIARERAGEYEPPAKKQRSMGYISFGESQQKSLQIPEIIIDEPDKKNIPPNIQSSEQTERIATEQPIVLLENLSIPLGQSFIPIERPAEQHLAPTEQPLEEIEQPLAQIEQPLAQIEQPLAQIEQPLAPIECSQADAARMLQEAGLPDILHQAAPQTQRESEPRKRRCSESSETQPGSLDRTKVSPGDSVHTTDTQRFMRAEWGVEGTMTKLLLLKRACPSSPVTVGALMRRGPVLPGARRMVAARCFSSLLKLKQHGFVRFTKDPTLEITDITLGPRFDNM